MTARTRKLGEGAAKGLGKAAARTREKARRRALSINENASPGNGEELRGLRCADDPPPQFEFLNRGGQPIKKIKDIPAGWNINDDDVDEKDIDAMIKRCKDRIEDNIMPRIWEDKLSHYEDLKAKYDDVVSAEPGELSFEVVLRLKRLESVKAHLQECGDPQKSIQNIDSVMAFYRSGKYLWEQDKATYWSYGKCVAGPEHYNTDRFMEEWNKHGIDDERVEDDDINDDERPIRYSKGFWVELHDVPGPIPNNNTWNHDIQIGNRAAYPNGYQYMLYFRSPRGADVPIRNPDWGVSLRMMDDTGCPMILIYENDLSNISIFSNSSVPYLCTSQLVTYTGQTLNVINTVMEIAYRHPSNGGRGNGWSRWNVGVVSGPGPGGARARLGGMYMRQSFFIGTAPETPQKLYVCSSASSMAKDMPNRGDCDTLPPRFTYAPVPPDGAAPNPADIELPAGSAFASRNSLRGPQAAGSIARDEADLPTGYQPSPRKGVAPQNPANDTWGGPANRPVIAAAAPAGGGGA